MVFLFSPWHDPVLSELKISHRNQIFRGRDNLILSLLCCKQTLLKLQTKLISFQICILFAQGSIRYLTYLPKLPFKILPKLFSPFLFLRNPRSQSKPNTPIKSQACISINPDISLPEKIDSTSTHLEWLKNLKEKAQVQPFRLPPNKNWIWVDLSFL